MFINVDSKLKAKVITKIKKRTRVRLRSIDKSCPKIKSKRSNKHSICLIRVDQEQ